MDELNNNTGVVEEATGAIEQSDEAKTYTAEQVAQLIQSEADKRVNQALAKQKQKYEKQLSLSKLDGDERAKAEKDQEIADLKEQLAAFQIERNRSELKSVLSSRGLSAEFADIINISDDIEASQANIDMLDKLFKAAVKAEVERRISGSTPQGNGSGAAMEITKDSAKKMTIAELQKLKKTNPELYNNLYN